MEKENLTTPNWTSFLSSFVIEIQPNELNCATDQLPNCFFNPNWDNSLDQSDPFESDLSSIVSSPVASNAAAIPGGRGGGGGDGSISGELIGRLGSICNSREISPQAYIAGNNNSSNTSCYSTPSNSPPKLNLSMMDSQIRGCLPFTGSHLPSHPSLAPFSADPGFAERAARFSCFGNTGGLRLNETELPNRLMAGMESGKMSNASSNQSFKVGGSQMGVQENNKSSPQEGNLVADRKFRRLSRPSTPENTELGDSREGSSVSEQIPVGEVSVKVDSDVNAKKRKPIPRGKAKETTPSTPSTKDAKAALENDESSAKRSKQDEEGGNEKDASKAKAKAEQKAAGDGNQKESKDNSKPPEPPKDYIHVRARRGQATDSHSLAERVRREKISERMKFLQDLVPGCNKVTGKAVMLDEIINYVQSLQRQVEFLSMKLATVNPRMDLNVDAHLSKDIFQSRGALPHGLYPLDSVMAAFPYGIQPQQVPPLQSGIAGGTENQFPVNSLNAALRRNPNVQLPPTDGFGEVTPQVSGLWEDDLQSVVQMGFGQNQQQSFHGSMASAQMKVEL